MSESADVELLILSNPWTSGSSQDQSLPDSLLETSSSGIPTRHSNAQLHNNESSHANIAIRNPLDHIDSNNEALFASQNMHEGENTDYDAENPDDDSSSLAHETQGLPRKKTRELCCKCLLWFGSKEAAAGLALVAIIIGLGSSALASKSLEVTKKGYDIDRWKDCQDRQVRKIS